MIWDQANHSRADEYWQIKNVDKILTSSSGGIFALSYRHFTELTLQVALHLRCIILKLISGLKLENDKLCSVPVAVAIPEGPLLPIAVASVHALNDPFFCRCHEVWLSVILIPLDPSDGFDRLASMLHEVRPALIVTASCTDFARIHRVLYELPSIDSDLLVNPIFQFSVASVVNLMDILDYDDDSLSECERMAFHCSLDQLGETESVFQLLHRFFCNVPLNASECECYNFPHSENRISHIVFTSGSTGEPKGCVSSISSLMSYIASKNEYHYVTSDSVVLLASAISFDPCISDILATVAVWGTLGLASRFDLIHNCGHVLQLLSISHILCTPTFWSAIPLESDLLNLKYPCLQVIALGGEPIPKLLLRAWLQQVECRSHLQLFATYGVTEACVYQTIGRIVGIENPSSSEQDVGLPFVGIKVRICDASIQDKLLDVSGVGEVILSGSQIDKLSSYLFRPELSAVKFVQECSVVYYRTGDRGYVNKETSRLFILGRIEGEEGSIKINGVRVELQEIETSLVDQVNEYPVVLAAVAVAIPFLSHSASEIHAYVVLSKACLDELNIFDEIPEYGLLCSDGPILALLRERCRRRARVIPSAFVIVPRIPMSPTGKRDRRNMPSLEKVSPLNSFVCASQKCYSVLLRDHGTSGAIVAEEIRICLNLQPCQMAILSTKTTFAMVGGDSLSATRVVRAIFAKHHNIVDNRFIGGEYGIVDGPLSPLNLLRAENLGSYVDFLDTHGICSSFESFENLATIPSTNTIYSQPFDFHEKCLFEFLLQSTSAGLQNISIALLDVGANPNYGESEGRLGKVSGRNLRKKQFRSNPLHLACFHGNHILVRKLLEKNAKYNVPNASSLFPLHLAASGKTNLSDSVDEDSFRLNCVKYLLQKGCPLHMRDGNNQTVLHAAARSGHVQVLEYCLRNWNSKDCNMTLQYNLMDNWARTPIHWAVLNKQIGALRLLIQKDIIFTKPKKMRKAKSSIFPLRLI